MSLLDTRHKKKSFTLTTILLSLLLFLMFYIGLSYLDPPIESGISVNFGTTDFGSGNVQPKEKIKSTPVEKPKVEEQPKEEVVEPSAPKEVSQTEAEEVVTQDNEESVVIKKQKEAEAKKRAEEEAERKAKAEAERKERERKAEEERVRQEQEAKKKQLDAMMGGLNSSDGTATGSEGNDNKAGDKGQPDGDPYASSYYGGAGSGSGGVGYGLNGRSLLSSNKFEPDCNEEGRVVVEIVVDQSGKVIDATPGVKGSIAAPCLLEAAEKTARSYRWNDDEEAHPRQIGFVVVNFKLGE
ncbi:energy transducer TonB [Galbibacter pacificus]|uniref:Energy transducer TonB n=1 Tax=Galbibacter pacificus TaxID=2996052 RepID=A0ABT6FVT7_9FLAO|nr:energy transducer TonB [Galbibacter pacificus]MDG3583694.1 energy transducer TonB [Galbibacter pacificus]MDG3587388.1 energy transducer TonB [Galbibacter pacificus]